jgi:hypothetical protein
MCTVGDKCFLWLRAGHLVCDGVGSFVGESRKEGWVVTAQPVRQGALPIAGQGKEFGYLPNKGQCPGPCPVAQAEQ